LNRQRTKNYPLTGLQGIILRIICTDSHVTYKTLVQKIHRDRITVLQSIESLIEQGYVQKQKICPPHEKSKLVFTPTLVAKHYAWLTLGVNIEDILKLENDEDISNYLELIKEISNPLQRQEFVEPLSSILTSYGTWQDKGKIDPKLKKDVIKEGFRKGIVQLAQRPFEDIDRFFNTVSMKLLEELFSTSECREFKNLFERMGNNLIRASKKIPI
jgi:hypothetical protein